MGRAGGEAVKPTPGTTTAIDSAGADYAFCRFLTTEDGCRCPLCGADIKANIGHACSSSDPPKKMPKVKGGKRGR